MLTITLLKHKRLVTLCVIVLSHVYIIYKENQTNRDILGRPKNSQTLASIFMLLVSGCTQVKLYLITTLGNYAFGVWFD